MGGSSGEGIAQDNRLGFGGDFELQITRDTKIYRRNFLTSAFLLKMFLT